MLLSGVQHKYTLTHTHTNKHRRKTINTFKVYYSCLQMLAMLKLMPGKRAVFNTVK